MIWITAAKAPPFCRLESKKVLAQLKTTKEGLSSAEAAARLERFGPNKLHQGKRTPRFIVFLNQFNDFLIFILIASALISFLLGEMKSAILIGIILFINACLGYLQESKAENAIEALKRLSNPKATVLRDGKAQEIDAERLVPGDIVLVSEGMAVSADCRIIEEIELHTQEAALTGESLPVRKQESALSHNAGLGDQRNMLFAGTDVVSGKATAVVVATAMHTEIGKIAKLIQEAKSDPTPLQVKIDKLGHQLGRLIIVICAIVFAVAFLRDQGSMLEAFLGAVALAVAAIPEGLPAVVTVSLGLGTRRMLKIKALIRKLPSVETLGSTTVICTDKTGTLTKNEMTVKHLFVSGKNYSVTGEGYGEKGDILLGARHIASAKDKGLQALLRIGVLCNNAASPPNPVGDPTEISLLVCAQKAGITKSSEGKYARIREIPFSSERKLMSTLHTFGKKHVLFAKGATEVMLARSTKVLINGKERKLTASLRKAMEAQTKAYASDALRVLAFGYRNCASAKDLKETGFVFVGLQAMMDPPREEARIAIQKCETAGIKVVMITGDHKDTAVAVANALGIPGSVMTGADLDDIADLDKVVEDIGVFARVNPEHKLKIVDALKKRGHIVAMTGDGVNDAPALKRADIGIAMGISGTDVAKEASQMVLLDDNFATIVNAVEEGRGIYANIQKFVFSLIAGNLGIVLTIFVGLLIGFPLPLLAIQLLWVNLVCDGLPALALGLDPAPKDVMNQKPRPPKENILTKKMFSLMLVLAIVMMIGLLSLFSSYLSVNVVYARSMVFMAMVLFRMFKVFNAKDMYEPLSKTWYNNPWLLAAIASSVGLTLLVLYSPLHTLFGVLPLAGWDLALCFLVASSVLFVGEGYKHFHEKHLH